jgi:hypothetical protein
MTKAHDLDGELGRLERHLPGWAAGFARWVREPSSRMVRYPLALALVLGGLVGFLPILGFWMLPLGLVIIANDVPFLRGPMARSLAYVNRKLGN